MGLWDLLHPHAQHRPIHLIGHISDAPQVVEYSDREGKMMVFHVVEAPGIEFQFKMLPTTPRRHKGDRVELTWIQHTLSTAIVEMMLSAPDAAEIHRRNAAYLHDILAQDAEETH